VAVADFQSAGADDWIADGSRPTCVAAVLDPAATGRRTGSAPTRRRLRGARGARASFVCAACDRR